MTCGKSYNFKRILFLGNLSSKAYKYQKIIIIILPLYSSICEILYVLSTREEMKILGCLHGWNHNFRPKRKLVWILPVTMSWFNLAILKIAEWDCAVAKFFLDPLGLHLLHRNIRDCLATWVFSLATWEYKVIEFTLKACLFMEMIYC